MSVPAGKSMKENRSAENRRGSSLAGASAPCWNVNITFNSWGCCSVSHWGPCRSLLRPRYWIFWCRSGIFFETISFCPISVLSQPFHLGLRGWWKGAHEKCDSPQINSSVAEALFKAFKDQLLYMYDLIQKYIPHIKSTVIAEHCVVIESMCKEGSKQV